ncbi:MAG: hypothetical protein HY696_07670 [Deltaproteobacteria bacterium]|nr:hypothetical protein [Deltaproteobacteria bacterium]
MIGYVAAAIATIATVATTVYTIVKTEEAEDRAEAQEAKQEDQISKQANLEKANTAEAATRNRLAATRGILRMLDEKAGVSSELRTAEKNPKKFAGKYKPFRPATARVADVATQDGSKLAQTFRAPGGGLSPRNYGTKAH